MKVFLWLVIAVLVYLIVGAAVGQRELQKQLAAREKTIAELQARKAVVDTEYVNVEKTKYLPARAMWDSIKITLGDKVKLDPVVIAGDNLAAACDELKVSCERRVFVRDSLLSEQSSLIKLLKSRKSSRFGCAAPLAVTTKGAGLGVACGLRF